MDTKDHNIQGGATRLFCFKIRPQKNPLSQVDSSF